MFKAKLITNESYYRRHRRHLLLSIIVAVPIGLAVNYYKFPDWISLLIFLVFGMIFYLNLQNQKMMQRAISSKSILFTEDSVQILSKNPAEQPKKYTLQEINSITLPASIKIPDESLGDVAKTLSGQQTKQYIIIEQANGKIKFDFLVNSYYMLAQLEKVVTLWENAGKKIQRV